MRGCSGVGVVVIVAVGVGDESLVADVVGTETGSAGIIVLDTSRLGVTVEDFSIVTAATVRSEEAISAFCCSAGEGKPQAETIKENKMRASIFRMLL